MLISFRIAPDAEDFPDSRAWLRTLCIFRLFPYSPNSLFPLFPDAGKKKRNHKLSRMCQIFVLGESTKYVHEKGQSQIPWQLAH